MPVLSVIKKEEENGLRLQLLRQKVDERLLIKFHQFFPEDGYLLYQEFKKREPRLRQLLRRNILFKIQFDLLLPTSGFVDSKQFDTSLLVLLLRQFCLDEPATGWSQDPAPGDWSDEANLVRFRKGRNKIQHGRLKVSDVKFQQIYDSLDYALQCYGCTKEELEDILTCILESQLMEKLGKACACPVLSSHGMSFGVFSPIPNFLGRDDTLLQMHKELIDLATNHRRGLVISGLGGVGKSETCRKYCQVYGTDFYGNNVLWMNAENESSLQQSFFTVAEHLQIGDAQTYPLNIQSMVHQIYRFFRGGKLLVVFDGVDTYDVLREYLPTKQSESSVCVLITSQNTNCPISYSSLSLKVFTRDDATKFLYQNLPSQYNLCQENCRFLIDFLQYHPLALQQAVSYIRENLLCVDQFNEMLKDHASELLGKPIVDIGQTSVMATFSIALEKLHRRTENSSALKILNLLCFLNGRNVKRRILHEALHGNTMETDKALSTLKRYSFINMLDSDSETEDYGEQIFTVHSLVQLVILTRLGPLKTDHQRQVLELILSKKEHETGLFCKQKHWCDHVVYMFNQTDMRMELLSEIRSNQPFFLEIFKLRGMYNELQLILEAVKETLHSETTSKGMHQDILVDTEYSIALLLAYQKNYNGALKIFGRIEKHILKETSSSLGQKENKLLAVRSNIASCLLDKNNYKRALEIFKYVFLCESKIYSEGDSSLLTTQSNIASCYMNTKKYVKALEIFRHVEHFKSKLYDSGDSEMLRTQLNIACCLSKKQDYDGALKLFYHIESYQRTMYDDNHPILVNTRNGIERCRRRMAQRKEKTIDYYSFKIFRTS